MLIYDLMSRDVVSVHPETPLKEVAQLLLEHRISGVPVVDAENAVVGVISESDFVIKERGRPSIPHSPLHWLLGDARHDLARVEAITAGEAMTSPPVTIEGRAASIRDAAITMVARNINRLPVTEMGKLVGIITRADLLRVYTQSDETIEAAVRETLRAVDGIGVESVSNGVVTLSGSLPSEALLSPVTLITEAIDGVVAVDASGLSWATKEPEPLKL